MTAKVSEARKFAIQYLEAGRQAEREGGFDLGDPDELDALPRSIDAMIRMVRRHRRRG